MDAQWLLSFHSLTLSTGLDAIAKSVLVISGPSCTGKSALSLRLAHELGGDIVNLDSVQVYRGLDIGSAKLRPDERARINHHLLDIIDPDQQFDVAKFVALALQAVGEISIAQRRPILVGGTTMYLTGLFHGLSASPTQDPTLRAELTNLSSVQLHQLLIELDPISAGRLHPNDRVRTIRAIEASRLSGNPHSQAQAAHSFSGSNLSGLILVLLLPRDKLYERINDRAKQMVEHGLVAETKGLIEHYSENCSALGSLGYKQAVDFLAGRLDQSDLIQAIAMYTRRFAKRQMTFWRNEPAKRGWQAYPKTGQAGAVTIGMEPISCSNKASGRGFNAFRLGYDELLERIEHRLGLGFEANELWYLDGTALL